MIPLPRHRPHAIVIGGSSGGVAALLELVSELPADLGAVVGVVLHVGRQYSILPELLSRRAAWPAVHPKHGQALKPGTIFVAPPDRHLLFTPTAVKLSRGPREHHARPALDPLFRSAALAWGCRTIGVVLTGDLDDGAAGLAAIKSRGGIAIVQDPADAFQPSMPATALASAAVDHCLPLPAIAPLLARLVGEDPTGHAVSARNLKQTQVEMMQPALWSSVRALQERELLLRRLAAVALATGDAAQAEVGRKQADRVHAQAERLAELCKAETNRV